MGSEWRETDLGDLLSFSNGRSSPERAEGLPYPVYGANGVIGYANQTNADANSIVIGRVGSYCGSLHFSSQPCWVTDNAIRAHAKGSNDPQFLFYLLTTLDLNSRRSGSGQPLLNQDTLNHVPVTVPTPTEQKRIAHILGTLDDKIELNRQMNKTLEEMARALFKSWFVDFDPVRAKMSGRWTRTTPLPGLPTSLFDLFPDHLVDSELGEVPAGWRVGKLGDVAVQSRESVRPDQIELGTPYIALDHMPRRCIALFDWGIADGVESNKYVFRKGDILFGKLRPYFHKVGIAPVDGVCSTDILVIRPKHDDWFGFVLEHVSSDEFVEYTTQGSSGTRMPRTSWPEMAKYPVVRPPAHVCSEYDETVRSIVGRIQTSIFEVNLSIAAREHLLTDLLKV